MPIVVQLLAGKALTVRVAADASLGSLRNPNTVRSYSTGVGKTAERIGEARPLGSVADDQIGEQCSGLVDRGSGSTQWAYLPE